MSTFAVLPGVLAIVAGLVLSIFQGGFPLTVWYPAALFLLVLLALALVVAPPRRAERSRRVEVALAIFGLFSVWALLSIIWAGVPGAAWDGANRIVLYAVVLGLVCLRPWTGRMATFAVGLVAFGTAAIALVVLVRGSASSEPFRMFVEGRLADPTGYLNATANLWLIGFFGAAHLACSRLVSWPVRGLGLASATLLLQTALLSQSRGAAIAFAVTVVAYVALTPRRWPALVALLVPLILTALQFQTLVAVRESSTPEAIGPALDAAIGAIGLSSVVALVLGCGAGVAARGIEARLSDRPRVRRNGDLGLLGLAVVALVAILAAIGNPAAFAQERWRDFKDSGYDTVESGNNRFGGSLGSGRYDFYRVAFAEFRESPVIGVGADNFSAEYLQRRRTAEAPQYPHSLAFLVLSQFGVVGALLLAAFLAAMAAAILSVRRQCSADEGAVVAAAAAAALVWLVHATGDWLWEFPALGVLGFAMLGVAARVVPGAPEDRPGLRGVGEPRSPAAVRMAVRYGFPVLVLCAAVSFSVPGISARYANAAYQDGGRNPDGAISGLERAADLNRLSADPLVALGVIAQRLGEHELAVDAFRRAVERAPENWFAHMELGLATALTGDVRGAEAGLIEAKRLNPRQPLTREILASIRRGEPVDPGFVEDRLNAQLAGRFSSTDGGEAIDEGPDGP